MAIESPLSNLCVILTQIKDSAALYQTTLVKNEAATRAVLVDPVLRALGWDTANTYMVEVEKQQSGVRLDYALYDNNNDVKVIVEAKSLGADLTKMDNVKQLMNYAMTFTPQGVSHPGIFFTDGEIWHHFTNLMPGNLSPTATFSISKDDPTECAAYFVQHLDAAKFWPQGDTVDKLAQQVFQLTSDLSTVRQELTALRVQIMVLGQTKPPAPQTKVRRAAGKSATPPITPTTAPNRFMRLIQPINFTKTKPSRLKLPSGEIVEITFWREVLTECCKFALVANPNVPVPLPDKSGRKTALLSWLPPAIPSVSHIQETYQGKTLYIYTNYSANIAVANALHILSFVADDQKPNEAEVEYA